jgi:nucleotide-binding universal stress UspA family protein
MAGEIVVGYDGSGPSNAALTKALELAGGLSVPVVLVYGYHAGKLGGEVTDYAAALHELGEKATADGVAHAREAGGAEPEVVIESGDPADVLNDVACRRSAAMVVIGTRNEHPVRGLLLGSVAHKLIHIADVPVLIVPAKKLG